jgi:hypothetical protein
MTADPCPHVLPCGACPDCCLEHHDHDEEARADDGSRQRVP